MFPRCALTALDHKRETDRNGVSFREMCGQSLDQSGAYALGGRPIMPELHSQTCLIAQRLIPLTPRGIVLHVTRPSGPDTGLICRR